MTTQTVHCSRHALRPVLRRPRSRLGRLLAAGVCGTVGILSVGAMPVPVPQPEAVATAAPPPADPVQVVASALTECANRLPKWQRWSIARVIHQESEQHGYDPLFITALVQVESGCKPSARGGDAIGLTQLLPSTARSVARRAGSARRSAGSSPGRPRSAIRPRVSPRDAPPNARYWAGAGSARSRRHRARSAHSRSPLVRAP